MSLSRILITAPASGSGKTTVTIGLLVALQARGIDVAPFKVGPDYIDPSYHNLPGALQCRNLDGWLLAPPALQGVFVHAAHSHQLAVIEGMMGLFDSVSAENDTASAAYVARLLRAPVVDV